MMAPRPPLSARAAHRRLAIIRQWLSGRWLLMLPCLCLLLGGWLIHPPTQAQEDTRTREALQAKSQERSRSRVGTALNVKA